MVLNDPNTSQNNTHLGTRLHDYSATDHFDRQNFVDSVYGVNENMTHIVDDVLSSSAPSSPDSVSTGLDPVDYSNGNRFDWAKGEISVGSLNVCGLKSKVHCPEFVQFVNKFTILCVVEIKLDVHDSIDVQNFTFFSK